MRGRLAAAAVRGLTPFVGREDELRLLRDRWERSVEGEGQTILIVGEAGIGKSRLVQRFREELAEHPHAWLESAAVPFFQNTPFSAFISILQQGFHWASGQNSEQKLAALEASLADSGIKLDESVPLLAQILELPVDGKYRPSLLPAAEQRKRLLASLAAWLFGVAKDAPLIIAIEDLHWADPSTLELIRLLVEQAPISRLLLLCTARPEFRASSVNRAHHTQITLNRMRTRDVREMIAQMAPRQALAADIVDTLIKRTSGVPLFIEELTRTLLENVNGMLSTREIPVTLHDSLMARMDRLGPGGKDVLQVAAVIGSEFSYELLRAIHPLADEQFQKALHSVADAELLYIHGIAPDATYQFKHALIRDAAYEALLKSRRKDLHRLIAQTISEHFPALKSSQPEVLARHWAEAGEAEQAIAEWSRAAKLAEERYAFVEAEQSLQQALALVNQLPESGARDFLELELRESLVATLHLTRGWRAPEVLEVSARMALLAEKGGNPARLTWSLITKGFHAFIGGDLSTAAALLEGCFKLCRRDGNPTTITYVRHLQVQVHHFRGNLARAENCFESGLKYFDDPAFRQDPQSPAMYVFAYASRNAWLLGRADVARERLLKMRAATSRANPLDVPRSNEAAALLHVFLRENETAEALATEALDLFDKYRFPNAAPSRCLLGYLRAQHGRTAEGIAMIRKGIDELLEIGCRLFVPPFITYLAAAQLEAGAIGDALETADLALKFNSEENYHVPETLRVRGEARLKQGDRQMAEADLRQSVEMARTMGAKAWELRATMTLARLLDSDGRCAEAHTMLRRIYNCFTEGFDTPDLKDAEALLEGLAASN